MSTGEAIATGSDGDAFDQELLNPFPGRPALPQLGMILYLASDLMLFAGFFAANFLLRSLNETWPPDGVELHVGRATIFTVVLILSSFTYMIALRRWQSTGDVNQLRVWTAITIALGVAFLVNQMLEYASLDFSISSHAYGSVYWTLTGLHALHVTVGVLLLCVVIARSFYPSFDRLDTPAEHSIGYFWHFVDVVWIAVYLTLFILQ